MSRAAKSHPRIPLGIFDSNLSVSGSRTGAFVTAAIVLIAFIGLPLARPFLFGTVGVGLIVGFLLRQKHNRQPDERISGKGKTNFDQMLRSL